MGGGKKEGGGGALSKCRRQSLVECVVVVV